MSNTPVQLDEFPHGWEGAIYQTFTRAEISGVTESHWCFGIKKGDLEIHQAYLLDPETAYANAVKMINVVEGNFHL